MDSYTRLLLVQLVGIIFAVCLVHGLEKTYNPLGPPSQFYTTTEFSFHLTDGPLSATTADYIQPPGRFGTPNPRCVRVVVFMAHGAILDHLQTECDTPESPAGLLTHDSALRYYNLAAFRQEAPGRFVSVMRTKEKDKCTRKVFVLEENSKPTAVPSPKVKNANNSPENSCDELDVALPTMLLLSSGEGDGKCKPVGEWMSYNAGEPLGLLSREVRCEDKCYQTVAITSERRVVRSVKLTCGPVHGVISTDRTLRVGDILYATVDSPDSVTVLINTGYNYCIKNMYTLEGKDRKVKTVSNSDDVSTLKDNNCRQLIKGEVEGSTVDRKIVDELKTSPLKNKFKQDILKPFEPSGELYDYNIARDMGIMVQTYTNDVDKKQNNIVTLVARGVAVLPVIVEAGPPKRIVIQDKAVYYDKDVAFTKLYAQDGYQVLKRLDETNCRRKLFIVKGKDGPLEETNEETVDASGSATKEKGTSVESSTTKARGNMSDDKNCKDLIEGLHLKEIEPLPSDEKKN